MLRCYVLPPDQLSRAVEAGGPLQELAADPDRLRRMSVLVVEVDGQVVGYWIAWYGLHLEPLWIHESHRNPAVGRALLEGMTDLVERTGETSAFVVLEDANRPLLEAATGRLGFLPAGATLYYAILQPAPEPVAR